MSLKTRFLKTRIFLLATLFISGCGANDSVLKSGKETPSSSSNTAAAKSSIEQDLEAMKTADFRFVYVLRRKDGGTIDAEDRSVIRFNTTDSNRRVSSDGDKAFIIGTNNQIPPPNMMALYERFAIEDHSPQPTVDANANSNK